MILEWLRGTCTGVTQTVLRKADQFVVDEINEPGVWTMNEYYCGRPNEVKTRSGRWCYNWGRI